jgi:hypothetical protein
MREYCSFCKHATNRKEWEDKLYYPNGGYDVVYCEEITCDIDGCKYHPSQFGCDGKYFEEVED